LLSCKCYGSIHPIEMQLTSLQIRVGRRQSCLVRVALRLPWDEPHPRLRRSRAVQRLLSLRLETLYTGALRTPLHECLGIPVVDLHLILLVRK
jgi:hypothetical protein